LHKGTEHNALLKPVWKRLSLAVHALRWFYVCQRNATARKEKLSKNILFLTEWKQVPPGSCFPLGLHGQEHEKAAA